MHNVTMPLLPVTGEGTRRRQKLSKKRGMLQHIDEVEENDPNSEKSTTGNQYLTQAKHICTKILIQEVLSPFHRFYSCLVP